MRLDLHAHGEALEAEVKVFALGALDARHVRDVLLAVVAVVQRPDAGLVRMCWAARWRVAVRGGAGACRSLAAEQIRRRSAARCVACAGWDDGRPHVPPRCVCPWLRPRLFSPLAVALALYQGVVLDLSPLAPARAVRRRPERRSVACMPRQPSQLQLLHATPPAKPKPSPHSTTTHTHTPAAEGLLQRHVCMYRPASCSGAAGGATARKRRSWCAGTSHPRSEAVTPAVWRAGLC